MKHKTYLFDFDGTLVDSMPTYISGMIKILVDNDIDYPDDIVKIITPLGYKGTAKYFIELGINMSEDELLKMMNDFALEQYSYHIPAKKNVVSTLKKLKADNADLNVLTASPHTVLDVCLKRIGIYDLFTNVWSCDDFNTTKADPQIYKMAADRIGKPVNEILFLDDNYNADKTAKKAGMMVCGVYDESSADYIEDIKKVADFYVYDLSELCEEDFQPLNKNSTERYDKYNSILSIMEFIRKNYSENHSVQYFANFCKLDKYYFIKLFREYTNTTPHYFQTKIRMEKAMELLQNTNMNNTEIAESVGYSSPYYFGRIFKKYVGISPGVYRKRFSKKK